MILYGSETGTAHGVAERVYRESKRLHFETHLSTMDDYRQIVVHFNSRYDRFCCIACRNLAETEDFHVIDHVFERMQKIIAFTALLIV